MFSRVPKSSHSSTLETAPATRSFPSFSKSQAVSEDALKQLINYEVIVLMDDSGSMEGKNWKHARKVMIGVVEKAIKYDTNGIEVQFLNRSEKTTVSTKEEVEELFTRVRPTGLTPLGERLTEVCNTCIGAYNKSGPSKTQKNFLIIAITDGIPTGTNVYTAVRDVAKELENLNAPRAYLGIQFVQIGTDKAATAFLKKLDDDLKGSGDNQVDRDIVDTVPYTGKKLTGEELVKILIGAINKRIDGKKSKDK